MNGENYTDLNAKSKLFVEESVKIYRWNLKTA